MNDHDICRRPRQKEGYRLEQLDDELLLYHLGETTVVYFNQTASLVWQLCQGDRTVGEIIDLLCAAYPEAADRVRVDVSETMTHFLEARCIEWT
ncbi:MAG: PqqD family protein [Lentisphaerae bacterium]|nr:PqqD family protein [Lentisphaerota bacterium]